MKKILGWFISWSLYWCGDIISRVINTGYADWLIPLYGKCMCASVDIQDWSGNHTPWNPTKGE